MTDGYGIRGPRGGEAHPGAHFQQAGSVRPGTQLLLGDPVQQEAVLAEAIGLEGLAQQPGEDPQFAVTERSRGLDVEARFGPDILDARGYPGASHFQQGQASGLRLRG